MPEFARQGPHGRVRLRVMKAVLLKNLRSAITLGLILWCAGAGCMLVSYAHSAAMSATEPISASPHEVWGGNASGSTGVHACCKARHASDRRTPASMTDHTATSDALASLEELAELPNSSNAMSCCPLTSGTLVLNGRQGIDGNASPSPSVSTVSVITQATVRPAAIPARLPDQNQTYLRDCVFLI